MTTTGRGPFSLEALIESEDLGVEIFHPGGLDVTRDLADLCGIGAGTRVLDVASGSGETACFLTESRAATVIGVDASPKMVARARAKVRARGLAIPFGLADAHKLPFEDGAFNVAISECTVCLLNKEVALSELTRVVRPGGCVGIHDVCWQQGTPERLKERLVDIEGERPETLDGWRTLFEGAGLVEVATADRSGLMPQWMKDTTKELGVRNEIAIFLRVLRKWGLTGFRNVLESERIFQSPYTGYGIIVGRKPNALKA